MSEAGAAKAPEARAGKIGGGNLQAPPPDKMDNENCQHNVLAKRVRPNEEVTYTCMKCGQPFKKPDELPQTKFAGGEK